MDNVQKFATADIAAPLRLRYWNNLVDRIYSGTFVNSPDDVFSGEMWNWTLGDLAMIRPRSTRSKVGRRSLPTAEERIILHMQCRGTAQYRQDNEACSLRSGDFVLGSAHRPYELDLTGHELIVIEFPRAPLAQRLADLDGLMRGQAFGGNPGSRVFYNFLLSLWQQGDLGPEDPDWISGVAPVFYDLLALAIRGTKQSGHGWPTAPAALRSRVLNMIEASLCVSDLRTSVIADACGISPRTIQNFFATMGTTPTAYILERRLRRAAEQLVASPGLSITQIAYEHGFADSAYFSRRFRRHFGCTPRAWRSKR